MLFVLRLLIVHRSVLFCSEHLSHVLSFEICDLHLPGEENSPPMLIVTGIVNNMFRILKIKQHRSHVISRKDLKGHHVRLFYKLTLEILVYIVKFIKIS